MRKSSLVALVLFTAACGSSDGGDASGQGGATQAGQGGSGVAGQSHAGSAGVGGSGGHSAAGGHGGAQGGTSGNGGHAGQGTAGQGAAGGLGGQQGNGGHAGQASGGQSAGGHAGQGGNGQAGQGAGGDPGTTGGAAGQSSGGNAGSGGADVGPPPCALTLDKDGFFTRSSPLGDYVGYLPKSYDKTNQTKTRLLVGMHGCGDTAYNFATWGMNPYPLRDTQTHIGISVEDTAMGCWNTAHTDKTLAAIDDLATCLYIDQKRITVAGYSSGAGAAYELALSHADRFDGLLIENGAAYDLGSNEDKLLAGAAWKLPIAHLAHMDDGDYTLAKVQADWAKIMAAGFPLQTTVVPGTHDGTSDDWANWLIPKMASWQAP